MQGKKKYELERIKNYNKYVDTYKKICTELGRALGCRELLKNQWGLPESRWFINHCPALLLQI